MQIDVKTAFLYGKLGEEIFLTQPSGFEIETKVCKLEKSIYSLKQASKEWNRCFVEFSRKFVLEPLKSDSCVLVNSDKLNKNSLFFSVDNSLCVHLLSLSEHGRYSQIFLSHFSAFPGLSSLWF